jgi:hypothetical protein
VSTTTTASSRYRHLESDRTTVLERARDSAKLTIPSLLPPSGHSQASKLATPFQGIGARGVNNLASKLLLALLPPNSPFFRYSIDDFALQQLTQRPDMRSEVEKSLNAMERAIMTEIETSAIRVSAFEALKQLIVAGNVLLYLPPTGGMRVFRLDRFVVKRDPMGTVLEVLTREDVSPDVLPPEMTDEESKKPTDPNRTVELYTHVLREKDKWVVYQEVKGKVVPGSKGTYPLDKSPWIPLRFTKIDGENYGRGYVEEYYGDLVSLEALTKAIVEGSAAAAKVLFLVNPNGTTSIKSLAESKSGDIRSGNAQDVSVLQLDKFADFRIALQTMESIQQRLSFAFLLNTAIQRAGERVTAEEIRYMAGELEDALGGVYSILSQEFQLPLINRLSHQMERQNRLPVLPKGVVRPSITTGLEALGRGHDLNKLDVFVQRVMQMGPEAAMHLNMGDLISRIGTSLGIDMGGLIRSAEEIAAMQQQQQMQAMMEKLGPKGMDIVRDQMNPQVNE